MKLKRLGGLRKMIDGFIEADLRFRTVAHVAVSEGRVTWDGYSCPGLFYRPNEWLIEKRYVGRAKAVK